MPIFCTLIQKYYDMLLTSYDYDVNTYSSLDVQVWQLDLVVIDWVEWWWRCKEMFNLDSCINIKGVD